MSCTESRNGDADVVVRDSAGIAIHEFPARVLTRPGELRLSPEPEVRIGVVQGAEAYQWTRPVAAARLSDGGFAVLERTPGEIRIFDAAGQYLRTISGPGDGPGELRSPVSLTVLPGDTIVVWDVRSRRLTWFSPSGEMLRERSVSEPGGIRTLRKVGLSPGGDVMALGPTATEEEQGNQGRARGVWEVVPLPRSGEGAGDGPPRSVGQVPGTERIIEVARDGAGQVMQVNVQGRWWWGESFAWPGPRGIWTADQLTLEARHFSLDRGLDRIVRVRAESRPFTPSLIDSLHAAELARVDDPETRRLWRVDFETRDYPEAVPPVASVFADLAGRVWIGLLDPPPAELPSGVHRAVERWAVFTGTAGNGGDGVRALGTLTLPPRSHPLWADDSGVLLVRNGEDFDIPYIEWYAFDDP